MTIIRRWCLDCEKETRHQITIDHFYECAECLKAEKVERITMLRADVKELLERTDLVVVYVNDPVVRHRFKLLNHILNLLQPILSQYATDILVEQIILDLLTKIEKETQQEKEAIRSLTNLPPTSPEEIEKITNEQ